MSCVFLFCPLRSDNTHNYIVCPQLFPTQLWSSVAVLVSSISLLGSSKYCTYETTNWRSCSKRIVSRMLLHIELYKDYTSKSVFFVSCSIQIYVTVTEKSEPSLCLLLYCAIISMCTFEALLCSLVCSGCMTKLVWGSLPESTALDWAIQRGVVFSTFN